VSTSVSCQSLPNSVSSSQLSTCKHSDVGQNKGSKPSSEIISPIPTTPLSASADNKNKFTFNASRGRKGSLSAIVDKLKSKGSGLDCIIPPSTSANSDNKLCGSKEDGLSDTPDENEKPGRLNASSNQIPSSDISEKKNYPHLDNGKLSNQTAFCLNDQKCLESILSKDSESGLLKTGVKEVLNDPMSSVNTQTNKSRERNLSLPNCPRTSSPIPPNLTSAVQSNSPQPPSSQSSQSTPCVKQRDVDDEVFKVPSDPNEEAKKSVEAGDSLVNNKHDSGEFRRDKEKAQVSPIIKKKSIDSDLNSPDGSLQIDDGDSTSVSKLGRDRTKVFTGNICSVRKLPSGVVKDELVNNCVNSASDQQRPSKSPGVFSGLPAPKGSVSPCEIDDDLMNEALGFNS